MAGEELLTIVGAATELDVSRSRVHQLLAEQDLDGPVLPPGRKRHRPGAGRVTRSSIERYLGATTSSAGLAGAASSGSSAPVTAVAVPPTADGASAMELKAHLDVMRGAVAAERARSRRLLSIARNLLDELAAGIDDADRLDSVTSGYSDALTQLLITDSAPGPE